MRRRRLPVLEPSAQVECDRLHATLPLSSCPQRRRGAPGLRDAGVRGPAADRVPRVRGGRCAGAGAGGIGGSVTHSIDEHLQRAWDELPELARVRWIALRPDRVRAAASEKGCRCKYGTCERCLRERERGTP